MGAEHAIVLSAWPFSEIGIDELPDQLAASRYLKEATEIAFADQRVAVRQALRV